MWPFPVALPISLAKVSKVKSNEVINLFFSETGCGLPLGVASGDVSSLQITSSSSKPPYWPHLGRLNNPIGWCADDLDTEPYLQVSDQQIKYYRVGWEMSQLYSTYFNISSILNMS